MRFLFHWFVKITAWIPQMLVFRTKLYYEDRRVQGRYIRGRAIVVSNHTSVLDVATMLFVFPFRTLRVVAAEIMYTKNMFMSVMLYLLGTIRVDREAHDFSFLGACERILKKGGVIEIYPEARLPKAGEERPLAFKPSAVYLALQTETPIIPVYTNGEMFSRKRLRVVIGKPIDVCRLYNDQMSEKENIESINTYLRGKVIELGQQIERKAPEKEAGK